MKRLSLLFALLFTHLAVAAPREFVVCQYNVENYVGDDQVAEGSWRAKPKTEKEIAAVIRVIKEINPDILGVCEMGSPKMFEDFKKRLNDAGLGYVDSEYVAGPDTDRHLALLSRFPIASKQSVVDVSFELNGTPEKVRRGFLDVTVQVTPSYQLRLVGAHLKSKLAAPEGEALLRRYEAQRLRAHLDKILAEQPNVNLVCYGDMNDTKNEPAFHEISGVRGTPSYMADLWAKDSIGDRWTHYWKTADLYSRIDYIFVSRSMAHEVARTKATVYRSDFWNEASDHRPVYATFTAADK